MNKTVIKDYCLSQLQKKEEEEGEKRKKFLLIKRILP